MVYKLMLPQADELILSEIEQGFEDSPNNVKFPEINLDDWKLVDEEPHVDEAIPFTVRTYRRKL